MPSVTVSANYKIVIPKEIRREISLEAGQVLQILVKKGVVILVPDRPLSSLRGFLNGMSTSGLREKEGCV